MSSSSEFRNEDSFQITLPSNASHKLFPANKPNSYRVQLQKTLHLEPNQWEVAMVDIQFPNNWYNLLKSTSFGIGMKPNTTNGAYDLSDKLKLPGAREAILYKIPEDNNDLLDLILASSPEGKSNLPNELKNGIAYLNLTARIDVEMDTHRSVKTLGDMICKELTKKIKKLTAAVKKPTHTFSFEYDAKKCIAQLKSNQNKDWYMFLYATCPYLLFQRFGFEPCFVYNDDEGSTVDKEKMLSLIRDPNKPCIARYALPLKSSYPATLENLSSMYIYSDLGSYQLIGDTSAQLLAIIPLQRRTKEIEQEELDSHQYYVLNPPYYIPLAKHEFNSIMFQLNTDFGEAFPFPNNPNNRVVCRLHFRRRSHKQSSQFIL